MQRFARFLLASFLLHVLAMVVLVRPLPKQQSQVVVQEPLEIEIVEVPKRGGIEGRDKTHKSPSEIRLSEIGLARRARTDLKNFDGLETEKPKRPSLLHAANAKNYSALKYLYNRMSSVVTYPEEFRKAGFEGTVSGTAYIERDGTLSFSGDDFASSNRFLRVQVLRTLRRFKTEPLPELFLKQLFSENQKRFEILLTFEFAFTENEKTEVLASKNYVAQSSFFFFKHHYRSRLQWELGPFGGLLPVPMVGFNPLWIYEKISAAVSRKSKVDPLDRYRNDPEY